MIDHSSLWEAMPRKGISQYRLLRSGIDNKTLDPVKKGNNITLLTLEKSALHWIVHPMKWSDFKDNAVSEEMALFLMHQGPRLC